MYSSIPFHFRYCISMFCGPLGPLLPLATGALVLWSWLCLGWVGWQWKNNMAKTYILSQCFSLFLFVFLPGGAGALFPQTFDSLPSVRQGYRTSRHQSSKLPSAFAWWPWWAPGCQSEWLASTRSFAWFCQFEWITGDVSLFIQSFSASAACWLHPQSR